MEGRGWWTTKTIENFEKHFHIICVTRVIVSSVAGRFDGD